MSCSNLPEKADSVHTQHFKLSEGENRFGEKGKCSGNGIEDGPMNFGGVCSGLPTVDEVEMRKHLDCVIRKGNA